LHGFLLLDARQAFSSVLYDETAILDSAVR